jgi:hypothetical protein
VPLAFAVTWDYRCPFARNAHEHVLDGLGRRSRLDVTFLPFSLGQVHVEDGEPDVWDSPDADSACSACRSESPCATHCPTASTRPTGRCSPTARAGRLPPGRTGPAQRAEGARDRRRRRLRRGRIGRPLATIKAEHTAYAASHDVWGVPTFIVGDQAAFVRFMRRPAGDGKVARSTIERTVDLLDGQTSTSSSTRRSPTDAEAPTGPDRASRAVSRRH